MELVVARIGKAHSLRGEVTVQAHTDDPGPASFRAPGSRPRRCRGRGCRASSCCAAPGSTTASGCWRSRASPTAPAPRACAAPACSSRTEDVVDDADEDAWYEDELVGLRAVDTSGAELGTVSGLEHGPAQDLLVLALSGGGTAYVPFVSEIVPEVDVEGGRVVLDPPPGLLELNAD